MGIKLTTEEFLKRAKDIHGNQYEYKDDFVYENSHSYIDIRCKEHGWFEQKSYSHLNGQGCIHCGNKNSGRKRTNNFDDVIDRLNSIHDNFYDYSKLTYRVMKDKVDVVCPNHGTFNIQLKAHLNGTGCTKCATDRNIKLQKLKAFFTFVSKSNLCYNDYYTYDMSKFIYRGDVTVTCPLHGEFKTTYHKHLNGQGCEICHPKIKQNTTSYLKSNYIKMCGDGGSNLYVLKMYDDGKPFYKIGITNNTKRRFSELPYNVDVELCYHSKDVGFIWQTERDLHRKFKHKRYEPVFKFGGDTECFVLDDSDLKQLKKQL